MCSICYVLCVMYTFSQKYKSEVISTVAICIKRHIQIIFSLCEKHQVVKYYQIYNIIQKQYKILLLETNSDFYLTYFHQLRTKIARAYNDSVGVNYLGLHIDIDMTELEMSCCGLELEQ